MTDSVDILERARREVGMSMVDLWLRYFALGGARTPIEVDAVLNGALVADVNDRDRLAVALNERFAELGGDHPVPYDGDDPA